MTLRLTTDNLPAAYEYLRATYPFRKWKLPMADDVRFVVSRHMGIHGEFRCIEGTPEIVTSENAVGSTHKLMETMAHEMIHLKQWLVGTHRGGEHNAEFRKLAKIVCKHHVFDEKAFS